MKKIYLLFTILFAFLSNAQTEITQNTTLLNEATSTGCLKNNLNSYESSFFRAFDLSAEFGINGQFDITDVLYGNYAIIALDAGKTVSVTVNLYATSLNFPDSFPTGYTLIGTTTTNYANTYKVGENVTVPLTASVPAGQKLVVEVHNNDVSEWANTSYIIGSNDDGQTKPCYMKATQCLGEGVIKTLAEVGFPDMHIIMNITGTEQPLSINENLLKATVVYPNPAKDLVSIQVPNEVEVTKVTLTDNTGKVFTKKMNNSTISIADFASGVYFLTIETDKGSVNRKIVKI